MEKEIFDSIFKEKRNIFLSGPGGTGKSFLILKIKDEANKRRKICNLTALTGVASLNIKAGTIHRWSGIKLADRPVASIIDSILKSNKDCVKRWKECQILVIDEISMLGSKVLEILDKVARKVRGINSLFGGIQLIISGDFLQLKPINDDYCFVSGLWNEFNFKIVRLNIPYRYPDVGHFEMLSRVRVGEMNDEDKLKLKSRCEAYMQYVRTGQEKKEEIKPTRLFSLKKDVNKFNLDELDKLPTESHFYNAVDKFACKDLKQKKVPASDIKDYSEYLDTTIVSQLQFKEGAQVMLTYNLCLESGLVNGSRGVIKECHFDHIKVLFKNGLTIDIPFNEYKYEDSKYKIIRLQIPLILAYASSIHKSQGLSLDYAILDLGVSLFSPALGYVSLSRVKCLEGIYITSLMINKIVPDKEAVEFEKKIIELVEIQNNQSTSSEGDGSEDELELDTDEQVSNLSIQDIKIESSDINSTHCIICAENIRNTMFKPCSHSISCTNCATKLTDCPICRVKITEKISFISS